VVCPLIPNDKIIYLLADTPAMRKLIGKYIEVYEYPDGRIELTQGQWHCPALCHV
jgi:hypothetical protein